MIGRILLAIVGVTLVIAISSVVSIISIIIIKQATDILD